MRLAIIDLIAYGLFTDVRIVLDERPTDFHVFFGGNEAGKTTALRALTCLLYGIPGQTADNFLHPYAALRIGGRLVHSDGSDLTLRRRKGNRNTLLGPDESVLGDEVLVKYLADVDESRFRNVFGIDHRTLARGAKEILAGGGDAGQSLFAAGLGTANLRRVLQRLDDEALGLFKARGSKQTINKAISDYRAAERKARDLSFSGPAFTKRRKTYEKLQAERKEVAGDQQRLASEQIRLERLQKVLPRLGKRRELLGALEPLADVPTVGSEFSKNKQAAIQLLQKGTEDRKRAEGELQRKEREAARLEVPDDLIAAAVVVNALHKELGQHRKAEEDAKKLEGIGIQLRTDARTLLAELRPGVELEDVESVRAGTATRARIRELSQKHQAIVEAHSRAQHDARGHADELEVARAELVEIPAAQDASLLRAVVDRQRKRGDLETARADVAYALQATRKQAGIALDALGLWRGSLDEVEKLALPTLETVDRFDDDFRKRVEERKLIKGRLDEKRKRHAEQLEKVESLQRAGEVVTEEELAAARERRGEGWTLIRQTWLEGEDVAVAATAFDSDRALPEAYEHTVDVADEVADRLRREADTVAQFAELQAHQNRLSGEIEGLEKDIVTVKNREDALTSSWAQTWAPTGIEPLSPREMRAWSSRHGGVVGHAGTVREQAGRLEQIDQDIAAFRGQLLQELEALGEPGPTDEETLAACLERSQTLVETVEERERRRGELGRQIAQLDVALRAAVKEEQEKSGDLDAWRSDWETAVANLGLPSTASPDQANAVLDRLAELFNKVDENRTTMSRLKGIERDAGEFRKRVEELVRAVAFDLLEVQADLAIEQMHERLASAKTDATKLEQLRQRIQEVQELLEKSGEDIALATEQLGALCKQVDCAGPDDLDAAERRALEKQELQRKLGDLESTLVELGGGSTVEELVAEAEGVDVDALPAQIDELRRQVTERDEQRSDLDQQIGSERAELARVDGADEAAMEAERAQGFVARTREHVERYVRLRIAADLLRKEIERYRKENQGPLLTRAGQLFSELTLGSFAELGTSYEKDEPVIVGVRPTGVKVGVYGMSDGTRDQLYLSLRLATLERYLEAHEPIPFIVDDILIRFDDDRALAALRVLTELSKRTQVLFFTHHARLVDLARSVEEGAVSIHVLSH